MEISVARDAGETGEGEVLARLLGRRGQACNDISDVDEERQPVFTESHFRGKGDLEACIGAVVLRVNKEFIAGNSIDSGGIREHGGGQVGVGRLHTQGKPAHQLFVDASTGTYQVDLEVRANRRCARRATEDSFHAQQHIVSIASRH